MKKKKKKKMKKKKKKKEKEEEEYSNDMWGVSNKQLSNSNKGMKCIKQKNDE